MTDLAGQFGQIDIYWFDQLLRGRVDPADRILDAGCGGGRNLVHLLREGYDVRAVDRDPKRVAETRALFAALAPEGEADAVREAAVEDLPFEDASFDVVISNAVLHFARDAAHFEAMLTEMLRVLAPAGLFFCRLATTIGLEDAVEPLGGGRFRLPDGHEWFLVDDATLRAWTQRAGGSLLDPIKTTNVEGLRCMTTWVFRRNVTPA